MANTTRIPAVIDALLVRLTADLTVPVYDGPGVSDDSATSYLLIGVDDPDSDDAPQAATARHEWAGIGKLARDQFITVHCSAVGWSGDTNMQTARNLAAAVLNAAEAALQANASITGTVLYAGMGEETWRQNQTASGSIAHALFTIECRARLSS